jgi:diguanylate cyclase (GGDEF)-like protein/excisionase family DNA binding protein
MHGTYQNLHLAPVTDTDTPRREMALQPRERTADPDALISVAQAAALLGVHPNTIRTWTEAGRLVAYRINARGDRRFRRSDVERLLVEGPGAELEEPVSRHVATPGNRDPQLAVMARLARGAGATASASLVCRVAVEALRSELGYPRVAVYLVDGGELVLSTHAGFATPPPLRRQRAGLRELVALDGQGLQLVEIVLGHDSDPVGLVRIEDEADGWLDATALPFLRTFGDGLAAAVHNANVLARARREVRRARALRSVTHELTGQLDPATVLDQIVERTRSLFDADKAGLWLVGSGEYPFELAAQRGLGAEFLATVRGVRLEDEAIGVRAVRERLPLWARNVDRDPSVGRLRGSYAAEGIRTACLVPLVGPNETLGLLGLYHCSDRLWPDDEVALVQAFANQAAVTIQNARLYRSVADQAARMRSIQDLSSRLNRLTDVTAIGEAIVAEASSLADYHDIRIYRIDWERRVCEPIAFTREMLGDEGDPFELLRVNVGEGLTGWAAEHGEALLVNDALADPRAMTIDGTDEIEESMLVVPMMYESRAVGVIVLSQLGSNRFTPDDLQTMSIFAGQAAQAMANADAYARLAAQSDQLARQLDSQRRLLEINERLLSTLDNEAVLESIADGLRTVVAYDNLSIFRADRAERRLVPVLARERYIEEVMRHVVPFGRGLMGWVVEHGEPVLANDALADPRVIQIPGTPEEPEAVIVVPLVADDEVIGAMNVGRIGREEVYFTETDFELVKLFAAQASIALRNADAHAAVSLRAETDALTGLGNHGAFQRDLGELLAADTAPDQHRVGLLMMDLDRFKAYNDRHGHPAGDALLHAIATAIYGAARSGDRVYRYGGDEFALILPNTTVAQAARVGNRIRRAVVELTSSNATPVTITVGVAAIPGDAADRAGLIAAADTALYYGKRSGENRVVRARDVPTETTELRGTLDDLARAALRGGEETDTVEHLVEQAARLSTGDELHRHDSQSVRDALLAVARSFETQGGELRGHADRVGRLAAAIAERLRLGGEEAHVVELAARLHVLDESGVGELEPIPSLGEVARIIRGYRALVSGSGDADAGANAHIVAAANEYDEFVTGAGRPGPGRADALRALRRHPARLRPDVLDALAKVVAARPDAGRRRRRSDPASRSRAKSGAA